ncbi:MAG: hypothetical protein JWL84_4933 [Rhodospirillales bacterium]|jgi:DNA-binding NtrC family response regulator|nr:hypothetical protein [Rhodospirillales bacterium]
MCTILLVEGDEAFQFATAKSLRSRGHEVVSVHSSLKALDVLESESKIDLILADLILTRGEPNGISLARMALMKRPGIKTVLMTRHRDIASDEAVMPAKLLYKPLDLDKLADTIAQMVPA